MTGDLLKARSDLVLQHRKSLGSIGTGAWFRDEDWDAAGNLIAEGEARLKALDPWANNRAKGMDCPPLGTEWPYGTSPIPPDWRPQARRAAPKAVASVTKPVTKPDQNLPSVTKLSGRLCKVCGGQIEPRPGRPAVFCSDTCRQKAHRGRK